MCYSYTCKYELKDGTCGLPDMIYQPENFPEDAECCCINMCATGKNTKKKDIFYVKDACCDKAEITIYNGKLIFACPDHPVKILTI